MRLPRFTTRRLMVLVAAVAILLVGGLETIRLLRVSRARRNEAASHNFTANAMLALAVAEEKRLAKQEEQLAAFQASDLSAKPNASAPPTEGVSPAVDVIEYRRWSEAKSELERAVSGSRWSAQFVRKQARLAAEAGKKLEHAARYPWLPVPPDTPASE